MPRRRPDPLLTAFGSAIRRMRKGRGWSQEELADRVGIHRTYVGDVERGLRNIGLINIGRIAVALGVSVATIMTEVERERTQG